MVANWWHGGVDAPHIAPAFRGTPFDRHSDSLHSEVPESSSFDGSPTSHSIITGDRKSISWGFRDHGDWKSSHEIQDDMQLAGATGTSNAPFSGQLEFALHENDQFLDHGSSKAVDHSPSSMRSSGIYILMPCSLITESKGSLFWSVAVGPISIHDF